MAGKKITRRKFIHATGSAAAGLTLLRWSPARAAQAGKKHIVIHSERPVTSLGYHNRRDTEHVALVDAGLVTQNPVTLERVPVLAEELPSVKKGTWKIDQQKQTMVTVYRLKPGLKWHDGKPYTSRDFEFGWQIAKHPEFPMPDRLVPEMIAKIDTPDDRTIVVHWNKLYQEAHAVQYTQVRAFPRHLLQDAFKSGDMKAFANHPFWNRDFVGVGPYRVTNWQGGKLMELEAFNEFILGRPKIDRITLRQMDDNNTNLAAVLAGEVDFCLRNTISFDGAMILRNQWEKEGKGKVFISPASWGWLNLSRDNPWFKDVRVRRALLHAIDRNALIKNVFAGEDLVSHFPLSRIRRSYKKALATATLYDYNPEKAKQLLAEAGWKPGSDGVLTNAKGERMEIEFRVRAGNRDDEQAQAIVTDYWQKIGARVRINNMPRRLLESSENRNRWPGAMIGGNNMTVEEWPERFHTKNIPTAENKFVLENVTGWSDPRKDAILDELKSMISDEREDALQVEFVKLFTEYLPHIPMWYSPEILVVKRGLTGITPRQESGGQNANTWNAYQWDKQ
jgi:peptide/nickel transport system substrate-binding protein